MLKKLIILIFIIVINVILLSYYLNIDKNELFYRYEYNIKPIYIQKRDLILKDLDIDIRHYFDFISLNKLLIGHKIEDDKIILNIKDNDNDYIYEFPYKYENNSLIIIKDENNINFYRYKKTNIKNKNKITLKINSSYEKLIKEIIQITDIDKVNSILLQDLKLDEVGNYKIIIKKADKEEEVEVIVEEDKE